MATVFSRFDSSFLSIPLFHCRPMEWSEEHDVLFLKEMLARNVFGAKKGSPARGLAWEAIVQLKVKKVVRERWNLLRKKMSEEARKRR